MNTSKPFAHWVKASNLVAQVSFGSSTICCALLIILTLFGVKRTIGSYAYLLVIFSTVGILFATVELMLYPHVHSFNMGYLFFSTSRPFNMSKNGVTWGLAIYSGVYATTVAMLSVQFVYRYWAIFDDSKLALFKGWRLLVWMVYCSIFGVSWACGNYYFEHVDNYTASYMKNVILDGYGINTSNVAAMGLVAYHSNGSVRWWNTFCILNMTSIMLIQYSVIFYCAYFMWRGMEEKLELVSASSRNIHKQFFKTLVLQITTPTILLFSPVSVIMYLPFFNLPVNAPTGVFLCSVTLYPAMDAMIIMCVVADYRKTVRNLLKSTRDRFYQQGSVERASTVSRSSRSAVAPATLSSS